MCSSHFLFHTQDLTHTTARTGTTSTCPKEFCLISPPGQLTKIATGENKKIKKDKRAIGEKKKRQENRFANVKVCVNKSEEILVLILLISDIEN